MDRRTVGLADVLCLVIALVDPEVEVRVHAARALAELAPADWRRLYPRLKGIEAAAATNAAPAAIAVIFAQRCMRG